MFSPFTTQKERMMKMLRRALEDANASDATDADQTVVMKGPLAEVYSKALDVAYAKAQPDAEEPPAEDVAVMESQQMDVALMQKLASAVADEVPPADAFQTVYGVSRDELTDDVVVEITQELVNQPENSEFILVVDATTPNANGTAAAEPTSELLNLSSALETIVEAHGGKVFTSLNAYAQSRK